MQLDGELLLSRGDVHFFSTPIPEGDERLEDALVEFVKDRGRGPGEMVESLFLDGAKRAGIGVPPGPPIWWSGWKTEFELPRTATIQLIGDESVDGGFRVTDVRVATQDKTIFENRPLQTYGGIHMTYNERRVATNAMNKMAQLKKNYPAKVVTERDFAKAQADALVEELSDDAAYQRYRAAHLRKVDRAGAGTPMLEYFEDEPIEDKVEKLRRQELGPETVYEVFTLALDVAADDLMDEFPGLSHAQLVGKLLDQEEIQKGWSYATTAGRVQSYDQLVSTFRKSNYRTQGQQAVEVINDLIGD